MRITLTSLIKTIRETHIDDPETIIVEAHCLAVTQRLIRTIDRRLAAEKGGAR